MKCEWILCPVCGSKTRNKIRKDTVLENYPLYCPKCRQEKIILIISTCMYWYVWNQLILRIQKTT
ncbi:conjugal transfer protein [Campylobacter coli]|nr:cysteine-rich KTR domain-containing protein [Campylobacter jejuni]TNO43679.1 conjugal transfer protein [Campylobacter coli]TNO47847.1 conjugal transfer protein [Campylobacter coli]TNO80383.1 conjugal transfer protein [Campylobacter coli]TNO87033.1 conjugal transfer protein [Campylobacter coli]